MHACMHPAAQDPTAVCVRLACSLPPCCRARRFLTGALQDVAAKSGLGQAFLGLIVLPIAGKGSSNWNYAAVPVFAPLIGAVMAGFAVKMLGI